MVSVNIHTKLQWHSKQYPHMGDPLIVQLTNYILKHHILSATSDRTAAGKRVHCNHNKLRYYIPISNWESQVDFFEKKNLATILHPLS